MAKVGGDDKQGARVVKIGRQQVTIPSLAATHGLGYIFGNHLSKLPSPLP